MNVSRMLVFLLVLGWSWKQLGAEPRAVNRDEIGSLREGWEVYPGQLYAPADFLQPLPGAQPARVPGYWDSTPATTFATYRLRFTLVDPPASFGLYLGMIVSSYRIWINGVEYPGKGSINPQYGLLGPQLLAFAPEADNEIVLQIADAKQAGGIMGTPRIGPYALLASQMILASITQGLLLGIALLIAMYHLLLFLLRRRERSHIYLALGCLALVLRDGTIGHVVVFSEFFANFGISPHFKIQFLGAFLITLGYFLFTDSLFPGSIPQLARRVVIGIECVAIVWTLAMPIEWRNPGAFMHIIASVVAAVFGIRGVYRRVREKEPYSLTFFIGIVLFTALGFADIFLVSFWVQPIMSPVSIASCVFSFFQAALLAQKNAKAYRDLEREQIKNKHAYGELSKLVLPHQLERLKAGEILEATMPMGETRAIVIQFDIIDSSRLEHNTAQEFFQQVFKRMNQVMERGYDAKTLTASGFRVKEMGDGFLCSVGFPFQTPEGKDRNLLAIELAEEFCQIFLEEERHIDHDRYGRLHCAIGIAEGDITGYFPKAGVKYYDLFGPGIILATRYESIRRSLFEEMDPSAIIIVQSRVYENVSSTERQKRTYKLYDLRRSRFKVRNDPYATHFYYQTVESLETRKTA